MGDHSDLPNYRKFLQPRRLHEQSQPLEKLDEVIEMIRELMIRLAENSSEDKLSREVEEVATTTTAQKQQQ